MGPEIIIAASLVILLFSVIIHEVAHGWVALKFGDRTALNAGRLTLNPLPHIDPIGTILLPLLLLISGMPLFGCAKPVPVNPLNFRELRRGEMLVSLAGIGANLAMAVISAILYHLAIVLGGATILDEVLSRAVFLNLVLAVFNLLPIPPLDGSRALTTVLPYELARQYERLQQFGFLILIGILIFPPTRTVMSLILGLGVGSLMNLLGVTLK